MKKFLGSLLLILFFSNMPVSWGQDKGRSIDLRIYCRKLYGDSVSWSHIRSNAYSWRCILGKRKFSINMNDACKLQYDDTYFAKLENPFDSYTWSCSSKSAKTK